jgi:hypothetical protein
MGLKRIANEISDDIDNALRSPMASVLPKEMQKTFRSLGSFIIVLGGVVDSNLSEIEESKIRRERAALLVGKLYDQLETFAPGVLPENVKATLHEMVTGEVGGDPADRL